jgi:hypothetical protein
MSIFTLLFDQSHGFAQIELPFVKRTPNDATGDLGT